MHKLHWHGCYRDNLAGKIHPDAFAHPAKMAWGLAKRIFEHLFDQGWLKEGDLVADPFGGIGVTGLVAAPFGCPCILVELEQKFIGWANKSFELHYDAWDKLGKPRPIIVQGDSRQFASIVTQAIRAVVTSPPYADSWHSTGQSRESMLRRVEQGQMSMEGWRKATTQCESDGYGTTPGQLGAMKEGDFEETEERHHLAAQNPQIGQKQGNTYWEAVSQVYQECFKVLKPGGVMAVVVKDFVRQKKRVPLCDQTFELLQAIGFKPLERIRAWVVSEAEQKSLMPDLVKDYRKERKSFFRRLAERKGSPRIDWKEVLICQKVGNPVGQT